MRSYECKIKGTILSCDCFTCFRDLPRFSSRPVCVKENITSSRGVVDELDVEQKKETAQG